MSLQVQDPNSATFRSIVKSFEVIIKYEQIEQKKLHCIRVLQKFKSVNNTAVVKQLEHDHQRKLMQVRTMLKIYRNAFQRITGEKEQYKQFKIPDGKISQLLLDIQQKINPSDYKTSYLRALTLKKKDFNWSKEFIADWAKAVEDQKRLEEERFKFKQAERTKVMKSQTLPDLNQPQGQSEAQPPKLEGKKQSIKENQKSVQKLPGEKPEKKVKRDQTAAQKSDKEKKLPKPKKQADDSQSEQNNAAKEATKKKNEKQQKQRMQQRYEKPREPKNRVKAFMQYLASRRQFSSLVSNPAKLKEMAEFLVNNLQRFMKHHMFNLIEIAKLRNRKHQTLQSSGNEFTYFSRQGYNSVKPLTHLQVSQQPARMLKISYKSKFELYSMLRSREQALQQSLLKLYVSKKDQQTSKGDKKLWEYLLRPNQVIEKTENFVEMEEARTDRLSIEIAHIRYLFQSHKFIRNSWLMMFCYNS